MTMLNTGESGLKGVEIQDGHVYVLHLPGIPGKNTDIYNALAEYIFSRGAYFLVTFNNGYQGGTITFDNIREKCANANS